MFSEYFCNLNLHYVQLVELKSVSTHLKYDLSKYLHVISQLLDTS